jgi:tagatose 6-phosphate kinase
VKIGRIEAVQAGLAPEAATAVQAAIALVDAGAQLAVVTDGAHEVAAADGSRMWRLEVPRVEAVNAVGSGDCFNAAMSLALMAGAGLDTALIKGVAAGSANALTLGAAMLDPLVARALEDEVSLTTQER